MLDPDETILSSIRPQSGPFRREFFERLSIPTEVDRRQREFVELSVDSAATEWFGASIVSDVSSETLCGLIARDIAHLDRIAASMLNAVLHHPKFQALEASWRGLHILAMRTDTADKPDCVMVKVLSVSWQEMSRDLLRMIDDLENTALFRKVYTEQFDQAGGQPYGVLLADYPVCDTTDTAAYEDDLLALREMSKVAATAFCPIVVCPSPTLLDVPRYGDLYERQDIGATFGGTLDTSFAKLRRSPDARFLSFCVPRTLMRLPYISTDFPGLGFQFNEQIEHEGAADYLWGSSVYAIGDLILRSSIATGWLAFIRGTPDQSITRAERDTADYGGFIDCLPDCFSGTDRHNYAPRYPVDVLFSDRHEKQLNDLGIMALRDCPFTANVALYSVPTLGAPMGPGKGTPDQVLNSRLNFVLCGSRFAHYIKIIVRDKIGSYRETQQIEDELDAWLAKWTATLSKGSLADYAKSPLADKQVRVRPRPGSPGKYDCDIMIKPRFQLDDLTAEFKVVTETPNART